MPLDEIDRPLQAIQNEILEMIARGSALDSVCDRLCMLIEELAPDTVCTVLRVEEGLLHPLATSSLPAAHASELDGAPIGPDAGSCGAAAYRGEAVLIEDIATNRTWEDGLAFARSTGLRACWSSPIKAKEGRVVGTFAFYFPVSRGPTPLERRAVETCVQLCSIAIERDRIQALHHRLAYFDTLTNLPNRLHAEAIIARASSSNSGRLGLLLVDIDNLKVTNDTLGHEFGDALIKQVADRLAEGTRGGTACRLGGDEFLIVLENVVMDDALERVAQRIHALMETPVSHAGITLHPYVTIGGASMTANVASTDVLRQNADIALYHAKDHYRGGFVEFSEELRTSMTMRIQCIRDVGQALSEDRIVPFYQPVVCMKTGRILAFEAFARMITPEGNVVPATSFAEAFREARISQHLTHTMMTKVAEDMRRWIETGLPVGPVGINLTAADWQRDGLAEAVTATFGAEGVPLELVTFEGTEAIVVGQHNHVLAAMGRLRSLGSLLVLDGFGTRYASMTHLLNYPVDVIKIDQGFVHRLSEPKAKAIVAAMIDIARALQIHVVAGGVETADQANELIEMGCLYGQGYYFYRPADAQTSTRRLEAAAASGCGAQRTISRLVA